MSVRMKAVVGHTYMGRDIAPGEEFECEAGDVGYVQGTFGLGYSVDDVGKVTAALGMFTPTNPATAKANDDDVAKLNVADELKLTVVAGDCAAIAGKSATVGAIDAGVITLTGLDLSGESVQSLDGVGAIGAVQVAPPPAPAPAPAAPTGDTIAILSFSQESPTRCTVSGADAAKLVNGDTVRADTFTPSSLSSLDGSSGTVANLTGSDFQLQGVDMSGIDPAGVTATATIVR